MLISQLQQYCFWKSCLIPLIVKKYLLKREREKLQPSSNIRFPRDEKRDRHASNHFCSIFCFEDGKLRLFQKKKALNSIVSYAKFFVIKNSK
jgi:hypothetical protein